MLIPRAARILRDEQSFRAINDRLCEDLERLPDDGEPVAFVCECGLADCERTVALTLDEFRAVHADPVRFAILDGHELTDVEDVVESHERFLVVRKRSG